MTGTLFRYFLKRHLSVIFWFLVGVTGLVYLVDFIEIASRRGDIPGFRLIDALLLTLIRVPSILQQTLPFVMLFAGVAVTLRGFDLVAHRLVRGRAVRKILLVGDQVGLIIQFQDR